MEKSANAISWFEIPASDLSRAKHFYQVSFGIHMNEVEMNGMTMALFPFENGSGKVSGALVKSEYLKPSQEGSLVYLNAQPDLQPILERITGQGGQIELPKTQIGTDMGYMAIFLDTEGNRIGLYSQH